MLRLNNIVALPVALLLLFSCKLKKSANTDTTPDIVAASASHPEWSYQSNIYEVNLRQYSASGSFKAFQAHLPRLKEMGVEVLWFMPVTPIGKVGRKQKESELGSYYAVRNYKEINEEHGTLDDWKALVKEAHSLGFKVITDWVANHSAPDNPWITSNPEFYTRDSTGKMIAPFDWTDVRELDYSKKGLRDSMIDAMKFWVRETDIDGFRCDVAAEVPMDFWKECIKQLKTVKNVFMLAEGDKPELHEAGFDATYGWNEFSVITNIFSGKKNIASVDSAMHYIDSAYPKDALRMYFTTNHDENSWNGTEFERMGDAHKALAVWTQTMPRSIPLIYSGQEAGNKKRLKFFTKDTITWGKYPMAPFYKKLLALRRSNKALAADGLFRKLVTGLNQFIYAYVREKEGQKVLVVLNLSSKAQKFIIPDDIVAGEAKNVFKETKESLKKDFAFNMDPWGYAVYDYNK